MFVITHALSPVILTAIGDTAALEKAGGRTLRRRHYIAIALSGAMPDLLYPHLSLAARYSSWTHTIWFLAGFSLVAAFVARRWFDRAGLMAALMIGACAFHLFCDAIAGGIAWAYPFSSDVIGDYYVPPSLWLWLDLGCLILTAALGIWLRKREHSLLDQGTPIPQG
jgi:membrane-bound metal-dependent hydrolase YbcI (DUF457 family)